MSQHESGRHPAFAGPIAEYARRVDVAGPGNLETFALQNRATAVRDVLAAASSDGRFVFEDLMSTLRDASSGRGPDSAEFVPTLKPKPLLSLARIVANQGTGPDDSRDAVMIFKLALAHHTSKSFKKEDKLIFCEELARLGHAVDLRKYLRILKVHRQDVYQPHLLMANATNPFVTDAVDRGEGAAERWLAKVNRMYRKEHLEPIGLAPGSGPVFDRILCGAGTRVFHHLKVTVIVPTYMSGPRIDTAIASLLAQSWQNLEILVMDDCSAPENDRYLNRWAGYDERVRVVKLPENAGTYRSRNLAVAEHATGDLVTVHDDDDWSHPRKIETQVRHLLDNPEELANVSLLCRATPELQFARINNNPVFSQKNYSSLMFWRSRTVERIGYWDLVNRSADAEFIDRIVAVTGRPIPVAGRAALSFLRVRAGSLTSGELSRGYIDPRRLWYQRASRHWHAKELEAGREPWIGVDNRGDRSFAAPVGMLGSKHAQQPSEVDVLYVTDYRFPGGNSTLSHAEISLLLDDGLRVGIMQVDSPLNGWSAPLQPRFIELSDHPNCRVLSRFDQIEADLAIVRHPSVMQFMPAERIPTDAGAVVVIANHAPHERDGLRSVYDPTAVVENADRVFGVQAVVAPESGVIRSALEASLPEDRLVTFDWGGTVVEASPRLRAVAEERRYVVGRHGRDHELKWPDRDGIEAAYPVDGSVDVRILGGADKAVDVLGGESPSWTVYPFGAVEPAEFLDELDFWVYMHHPNLWESFGMAAAEAIAAGLVVVLPPYMSRTFGDGAVYAEPSEVLPLLNKLWANPSAYRRQSQQALDYARDNLSPDGLRQRVRTLRSGAGRAVLEPSGR